MLPTPDPELSSINPSTTNNGWVPDRRLPTPRIIISCDAPGSPLEEVTFTPETTPWSICPGFTTTPLLKSSASAEEIAPATSGLPCTPQCTHVSSTAPPRPQ